jgi:phosphoglycolate phosphatase-like HAD superfamily hydrolase
MTVPPAALESFSPSHSYFVGIDSDGCAFDTMELKHKECFIPNTIFFYELQSVSKYAREAAEFVNLYSQSRGENRFPALKMTMDLLAERPEVKRRAVKLADMEPLQRFIKSGKPLGNPALKEEVEKTNDPALKLALEWSEQINRDVARMVHGVAPFPFVRECLEKLSSVADMAVVSGTPVSALRQEWEEHELAKYVALIVGQELASKKETLRTAASKGYDRNNMLMIGDAPGDLKAAEANGALFFPVVPGEEETSWEQLYSEGLDHFLSGDFAGEYQDSLIKHFLKRLPSTPPWKR